MSTTTQVIAVLKSTVHERRNLGTQWLSWLSLLLVILALLGELIFMPSLTLDKQIFIVAMTIAIPFAALAMMWWIYFVSNALRQCVTAVSKLVPMQRPAVAWALTIVWLSLCSASALALAFPMGKALSAWLICGAFLGFIAIAMRYPKLWLLWAVGMITPALGMTPWFQAAFNAVDQASNSFVLSLGCVLISLVAWCLILMGLLGPRRLDQLRNQPLSLSSMKMMGNWNDAMRNPQQFGSFLSRLPLTSSFSNIWVRMCSQAGTSISKRLSLSLGNMFNPVIQIAQWLFGLVLLVIVLWVLQANGRRDLNVEQMVPIFCITAIGSFLSTAVQAFWQTRREQALMCLLPGVPQGEALNRLLFKMLLKRHVITSLLLTVCTVTVIGLFTSQWSQLGVTLVQVLPPLALLCACCGLRNYAIYKGPSAGLQILTLFGSMGVYALLMLASSSGYLGPAASLCLLLSAGILVWRWRVMTSAPQAWPTGRSATFGNKNYNAG